MSAMLQDRTDYHRRRIRRGARTVSWVFAPLFFFSISLWLLFNAVSCGNDRASVLELRMCGHAHLLPDLFALMVVLSLG